MKPTDPIYQQPTFVNIGNIGDNADNVSMIGAWRLVYPRVNSYTFENRQNGLKFNAIKMDVLRGENIGYVGDIRNQSGDIVNKKILLIDRQTRGSAMKVYNDQTNTWDQV